MVESLSGDRHGGSCGNQFFRIPPIYLIPHFPVECEGAQEIVKVAPVVVSSVEQPVRVAGEEFPGG